MPRRNLAEMMARFSQREALQKAALRVVANGKTGVELAMQAG